MRWDDKLNADIRLGFDHSGSWSSGLHGLCCGDAEWPGLSKKPCCSVHHLKTRRRVNGAEGNIGNGYAV